MSNAEAEEQARRDEEAAQQAAQAASATTPPATAPSIAGPDVTPDSDRPFTPAGTEEIDHTAGTDLGRSQVQATVDEMNDKGFLGQQVDPTPDQNYTLTTPPDAPTPETDAGLAAKARDAALGNRFTAIEQSSAHVAAKEQA